MLEINYKIQKIFKILLSYLIYPNIRKSLIHLLQLKKNNYNFGEINNIIV